MPARSSAPAILCSTGSRRRKRCGHMSMFRKPAPSSIHVGQPAVLTVSEFSGPQFHGTVIRTANALDPATRTMLVEVDIPNADGTLFPGTLRRSRSERSSRPMPPLVLPAIAIHLPNGWRPSRRRSSRRHHPSSESRRRPRLRRSRRNPSGSRKVRRSSLRPATRRAKAPRSSP